MEFGGSGDVLGELFCVREVSFGRGRTAPAKKQLAPIGPGLGTKEACASEETLATTRERDLFKHLQRDDTSLFSLGCLVSAYATHPP